MTLRGLDDIRWSELWVEYGLDASALPALLQQVVRGDVEEATQALTAIRRTVRAGQLPSEAAAPTIPFLGQALQQCEHVAVQRLIVELLHDLGVGRARALFPARPSRLSFEPGRLEEDEDDEFPTAADKAQWQLECQVTVELLVPNVLPLLEEVDDGLVSSAIALLASFPPAAPLSTPALWKLTREEDDSPLGGQALVALAQLGAPGVADAARVMTDAHQGTPLGFWSAVADVLASPAPTPVGIHELPRLPRAWAGQPCPFTGRLSKLQRVVLARLPRSSVTHAIAAVVAHPNLVTRLAGARVVVRWAALSSGDDQRSTLALLAEHGPWENPGFLKLLEEYEFPTAREALSAAAKR